MPRPSLRTIRSLLWLPGVFALLGLAACAPLPTATASATPTWTPYPIYTPTPTATPIPAATPTNVPDGWAVLDVHDFSIAFPQGSKLYNSPLMDGSFTYTIQSKVGVMVQEPTSTAGTATINCQPVIPGSQQVTLAGLPMTYAIAGGEGGYTDRAWYFVSADGTSYELTASDTTDSSDIQAQDDAILATFRPDNSTPSSC